MLSELAEVLYVMVAVILFVPKMVVRVVHEALYKYYPESIGQKSEYVFINIVVIHYYYYRPNSKTRVFLVHFIHFCMSRDLGRKVLKY